MYVQCLFGGSIDSKPCKVSWEYMWKPRTFESSVQFEVYHAFRGILVLTMTQKPYRLCVQAAYRVHAVLYSKIILNCSVISSDLNQRIFPFLWLPLHLSLLVQQFAEQ